MPSPLPEALAEVRVLLLDPDLLVRAVAAGRRRGSEPPPWRRVELRPVDLKAGRRLQIVAHDERQATTSNEVYGPRAEAAVDLLLAQPFGNWHVETRDRTVQLRVTKKGDAQLHSAARAVLGTAGSGEPTDEKVLHAHDRAKPRLLDPADPLLRELGISDAQGRVKPSRQAKYRQVEEMLRALAAVREALPGPQPDGRPLRVVDLGCGNAYLSFAAYRWLTGPDGAAGPVELVGVDVKEQAREHGEKVAAALGWSDAVRFVAGAVLDAPVDGADLVLALHACDTATDEALARAVGWQAPVILASPCCHHDIQRQLSRAEGVPEPYGVVVRHAILRERFADVLTDALRAAVLRLVGYRVEVVEFVGSQHTPRNTLIRAVRTGAPPTAQQAGDYAALTRQWNVVPRLATLVGLEPLLQEGP
jgi:SAM-dependent methyltransferase